MHTSQHYNHVKLHVACTCTCMCVEAVTYFSKPLRLRDKLAKLFFVCVQYVACACNMFVCLFLSLLSFLFIYSAYISLLFSDVFICTVCVCVQYVACACNMFVCFFLSLLSFLFIYSAYISLLFSDVFICTVCVCVHTYTLYICCLCV